MLGATGLNAVERLFIGSVSESVIRNASCDVLVVRTDLDNKLPKMKKNKKKKNEPTIAFDGWLSSLTY